MTAIQKNALGVTPLPAEQVERLYAAPTNLTPADAVKRLCLSHERLRAELEGAEVLIEDAARREATLRNALEFVLDRHNYQGDGTPWPSLFAVARAALAAK